MKQKGIVKNIFFPKQYKDGILIDVIDRTIIGFKLLLEDGSTLKLTVDVNENNSKIFKDDHVIVYEKEDTTLDIMLDGDYHE